MKKRTFIKTTSIVIAGTAIAPLVSCNGAKSKPTDEVVSISAETVFTLPALDFAFDALAPNIDAQTMEIHHGKHHAGYVKKFNAALVGTAHVGKSLNEVLTTIGSDDTGLRNNGGGHYNHTLYWESMSPNGGGAPSGDLSDLINANFDSFDNFKSVFKKAATTRFGSGWAWLCKGGDGKLFVSSTPNQDNPMMNNITSELGTPLLGIDVWEHAYYLNYQNRRGDYVDNFFNVINWDKVAERLS